MLQHQQGNNHFRLSTLEDIKYLAPRLRFEDKREILANSGLTPYEALHFSYKYSDISFTIVNSRNEPVAIFGINDAGNNVGACLLYTSDAADE